MSPILIQSIGLLGLFCILISFQKDNKSFTLIFLLIAALFFTIHFSLLNAWTAAAMNFLSATRALIFYFRNTYKWIDHKIVMYIFILLFWLAGILTWESYLSLFPVISMTFECFALWSSNTKHIRWLFLSARPTWIMYNFAVGSYAGLLTEAFVITSLTIAIIRFDILKRELKVRV